MASLSNINGIFDVHSTGAILFSTSHGTSGQILKSNGNAAPTWIPQSDIVGDYLPLSGGTLTGATATASGISFTVGGALTGTTATFSGTVTFNDHTYHPDQVKSIFGTGSDAEIQFNGSHLFIDNTVGTTYLRNTGTGGSGFIFRNSNIGDFEFDNEFAGNIKFNTSNIERMRIDSSGNVGIGTTTPGEKLEVDGNAELKGNLIINKFSNTAPYADGEIRFTGRYDRYVGGIKTFSDNASYPEYANGLDFFVQRHVYALPNGHLAMRIDSEGNVGIGTTSPGAKLEIAETAASTDCIVRIKATRDAYLQFSPANTTKWGLIADYPALGDFTMYNYPNNFNAIVCKDNKDITTNLSGGNFGIGTTSPDAKLEVASDITIQNGVYTYKTSGYTSGATAINVDITVGNEGGAGNVFKIEAGFAHYFAMTYNSVAEWWCTSRGTSVVNTYILNAGTTLAGDWSASKPNTTTLRITKTA